MLALFFVLKAFAGINNVNNAVFKALGYYIVLYEVVNSFYHKV